MIKTEAEYRKALRLAKSIIADLNEYEDKHYPTGEPSKEIQDEFRKEQESQKDIGGEA